MEKLDNIDTVILCGGLGTRLRTVVSDKQKVMAQIGDHPFLDHILGYLKSQGLRRFILCSGYKAGDLEKYYRNYDSDLTLEFSRETQPLGTGGAIKNACPLIRSDPFFAINGDSYCAIDYSAFLQFHQLKGALASLVAAEVLDGKDCGSIALKPNDEVQAFVEKLEVKEKALVNAGIYCFNQDVLAMMPETAHFSMEYDVFPAFVGKKFFGFTTTQSMIDIGTPARYQELYKKGQLS